MRLAKRWLALYGSITWPRAHSYRGSNNPSSNLPTNTHLIRSAPQKVVERLLGRLPPPGFCVPINFCYLLRQPADPPRHYTSEGTNENPPTDEPTIDPRVPGG